MQERYIVTTDLGSSKIAVGVARATDNDLQVIYYRESASDGIRHGCVFNPKRTARELKNALNMAEDEVGMKFSQVVVGLPRSGVHQETATATLERTEPGTCITVDEVETLKNMAMETYPLSDEHKEEIYGAVAQYFSADDLVQQSENDVVGAPASSIQGNFKVFVGAKTASTNVNMIFHELGIAVADKIFVPHAVAGAVLSGEERDNGVALVEMGAGVTSLSIYKDKILRYYGAIPFGGKTITDDIKNECGFKFSLAENIKLAYGACLPEKIQNMSDKILQINDKETGEDENLQVKYLSEIITARVREIVDAILYLIQESGYAERLRNGVVLTGGCAVMANIATLIKEMSGYSVRIGFPRRGIITSEGYPEVHETSAAASVGLILNAARNEKLNCVGEIFAGTPAKEENNAAVTKPENETEVEQPDKENEEREDFKKGGNRKKHGSWLSSLFTDKEMEGMVIKPEPNKEKAVKKHKAPKENGLSLKVVVNKVEEGIGKLFEDAE